MMTHSPTALLEQERANLERQRREHPETLFRSEPPTQDFIFPSIGIDGLPLDRPTAYLRLYPQDFLVEEISQAGSEVRLTEFPSFIDSENHRTLWAVFIKAKMMQFDALKELATGLGIPQESIGYAGIKDAIAITSQCLSLRGVTKEQAERFHHKQMLVLPYAYGNGSLQSGNLQGNRFTITLRTSEACNPDLIRNRLEKPFWNFFGIQRFGSRFSAHKFGQSLLQGNVDACLKLFFTQEGLCDLPFHRSIRKQLAEAYGDWKAMEKICEPLPFTLMDEIRVLQALQQDPRKTRGALSLIREQVRMWVYAYGSWLMNRELSRLMQSGEEPPATIPIPFSPNGPYEAYAKTMRAEGTDRYREVFAQYPFLSMSDKTVPTRMEPQNVQIKTIPQGCIVRFSLDKGAYATTCLSHAFQIVEGLPVPSWVQDGPIDGMKMLGEPSLQSLLESFDSSVLARRDATTTNDEASE